MADGPATLLRRVRDLSAQAQEHHDIGTPTTWMVGAYCNRCGKGIVVSVNSAEQLEEALGEVFEEWTINEVPGAGDYCPACS